MQIPMLAPEQAPAPPIPTPIFRLHPDTHDQVNHNMNSAANITLEQIASLAPLLITCATAVIVMLSIAYRRHHFANATITVLGLNAALFSVLWVGQGPSQNITELLVVDHYALFFMALVLVISLGCATLSHAYIEQHNGNREELYVLLLTAAAGGLVLASATHLVSFFIGLELLSVPLYGMVAYRTHSRHSLEAGFKYLVLSAVASAFLLFGMALIYAATGTMSFGVIAQILNAGSASNSLVITGLAMMIIGLGFKLSLAPFHMWTPDVYEGAPAPVGAFLATAAKVALFAVVVRFMLVLPAAQSEEVRNVLTVLAIASILVGNILALMQNNVKRLLGYSSIAHFGYLLIALIALGDLSGEKLGVEAVAVYLLAYTAASLGAFGVVTLMSNVADERDADSLQDFRGLFWRKPFLAVIFTVSLLSLAGIPLTAGFVGKFYLATVGVGAGLWYLLGALIVGSAIGVYYYLRVMTTLFMREAGMSVYDAPNNWGQQSGGMMVALLAVITVFLGIFPQVMISFLQGTFLAP
jgi:NADH-quinone oxidoreductase subunit N